MIRRSLPRLALVLVTLGGSTFHEVLAAKELPSGSYRLQKAEILDRQGFGRVMTAVSLFVPIGWSTSGGVLWQTTPVSCGKNATRFEWRAASPDGASAIEILPEETWSGNNLQLPVMSQCPNVTITTVQEYLRWYVTRVRPGARILDYRDRPEFTETLAALNRQEPGVAGELKSWVQGGEILVGYELNGRDTRESIAITVIFMLNRMSGVMPGEIREFLTVTSLPALAVRAPHGQLDFTFTETIRRSIKTDPAWSAAMAEHTRKMGAISAKGEADRFAIRTETARQISEMQQRGYEDRQASLDRSHQQFSQVIRGVDTYMDTQSRERVELPNTYDHVWRLNDGTYILTNDAGFQPGTDLGVDGRQLEVAK